MVYTHVMSMQPRRCQSVTTPPHPVSMAVMLVANRSMTTENNDIGKIAKSFLFIGNLLLINFVIGEFIQEPTNLDVS